MPFVSQSNLSRGTGKCIVDLGCELYARRSLGPNQHGHGHGEAASAASW